jgi:hypothetical protein
MEVSLQSFGVLFGIMLNISLTFRTAGHFLRLSNNEKPKDGKGRGGRKRNLKA